MSVNYSPVWLQSSQQEENGRKLDGEVAVVSDTSNSLAVVWKSPLHSKCSGKHWKF